MRIRLLIARACSRVEQTLEGRAKCEALTQVALHVELTDVWHLAAGRRFGLYKHLYRLTS
jgi:hypothetical protein